jgi:hypothetical protein
MSALSPFIDWEIQARAHRCAQTHIPFKDGENVYSILARSNFKGKWQRYDYSESGWMGRPKGLEILCLWQSVYKKPENPVPSSLVNADPEMVLRGLLETKNPEKFPHCTILALMLERKRKLKFISRHSEGGVSWGVYEHLPTGEMWVIPEVIPDEKEIEEIQSEIIGLLPQP